MDILSQGDSSRPGILRYGVAVVAVLAATALQLLIGPISNQVPFLLFLAAITLAAWFGGLGPGLLATALSALLAGYFFLPPYHELDISDPSSQVRLALFVVVAIFINVLSYARSRAEVRTVEQRERLRVTLASIGDAVIASDAEGRVAFMNPVAERLTSWSQAQALGQPVSQVFNIVNEQTRQPVENPVDKALTKGTTQGLANHTVLVARDGSERPIDDSGAPIRDDQRNVLGAILVFRDIGERRRAEIERARLLESEHGARMEAEAARDEAKVVGERLEFLAEASRVLGSSLDYETTLRSVARLAVPRVADWCAVDLLTPDGAVERLAVEHVDPAKIQVALDIARRYPPDREAPSGLYNVIRTGKPEVYAEISEAMLVASARDPEHLELLRALGFTSALVVPLVARERVLGALTFVSAESGRKYGEDDLALAEDLARRAATAIDNAMLYNESQAAIRARDQFLSVASHELKTPLSAVKGYTQLVQRRIERTGEFTEKDRQTLAMVVRQTDRLNRMILSLLDVSRIQTGQLSLETKPTDLGLLAERVVEEMRLTTQGHTLEVERPGHPLVVVGDELRLEQVLVNLLQNARKYDPAEGKITVKVGAMEGGACVSVSDRGVGIPEEAQSRLFQRYFRAPNVAGLGMEGMGIGLYVVKEIVALHGGEVSVESKEGEGSTFTFCLPVQGLPSMQPSKDGATRG
ncbi:MAG: ATP-binding protein [Chloroflexia bacterium]